jgi:hypothetical protein
MGTTKTVHSDNLAGMKTLFFEYREDLKKWVEFNKWTCVTSICECNHKMETIKEEPTDEIVQKELHNMHHIPYEARFGKKFWTQYKTKHGGVPEFNPVTKAGNSGEYNPNNL